MRFNPCIQWVKLNINQENIRSISGQYISNTLVKKPKGWRNGSFSGVLNEVGSHIIDLIQYILGENEFEVIDAENESVISETYLIDQQQVKYLTPEGDIIRRISVTDIAETVPFYLRGIDFTKQIQDLLGNGNKLASLNEGLVVNKIMNKIINHENNIRR